MTISILLVAASFIVKDFISVDWNLSNILGILSVVGVLERSSGRSRGFGYVTFASMEYAKNALESGHYLGKRMLEVKVANRKEEMRALAKKVTRIFVSHIPPFVAEGTFRRTGIGS